MESLSSSTSAGDRSPGGAELASPEECIPQTSSHMPSRCTNERDLQKGGCGTIPCREASIRSVDQ
eukprot:scaffold1554_cov332-Pavlova_lutheri.AAC.19